MESTQQQLEQLAAKVTKLQAGNLQEFQKQILDELYQLRQTLVNDIKKVAHQPCNAAVESNKDKEIKRLEEQNRKQAYRIQHLAKNLGERLK